MDHPTSDRNFRLPTTVRPRRYAAHLRVDLEGRIFEGRQSLMVLLDVPSREIVLHAADLNFGRVTAKAAALSLDAEIETVGISETAILRFAQELPAGPVELEMEWSGAFCSGLRGLYMGGTVAVTQFEAADARRVFPSFDEPSFKASWAISVDVPQDAVALSNGRMMEEHPHGTRKSVRFEETEILPSYLVALAIGDLACCPQESVGGVPVRTWATKDKLHLTAFGQEVALAVLPRLQDYFGLPYAFGKLDQVGIPDFEAGAMENAGLVTYRELALLVDPKTASLPVQKRIAEVVTHELAHQWFGNWVTMVWWDDLWLNEAFATWMAFKIVDQWRPQWRIWLDFDSGKASALFLDALQSTHPIRSEVHNAAEATESFDVITYEKGGAVLRMIEGFLGEERFREGIRSYMKRHGRANAVADDLWRALSEASNEPVLDLANAWIRQSGFPLISLEPSGSTVKLSQRRFYSGPGERSDETWPVPMVLRYRDDVGIREQRLLLSERSKSIELPSKGPIRWIFGNVGNSGFYRVAYDEGTLTALAQDFPSLAPSERIALVADQWALVRSGEREIGSLLDLLVGFGAEEDNAVLDELVARVSAIDYRLVADPDAERFRQAVRKLFGERMKRAGFDAGPDEPGEARLRRAALVRAMALVGRDEETLGELRARLDRVLGGRKEALEANLHDAAVVSAARVGDAALFDRLLSSYKDERDPAFKRRYLQALTQFEDPALSQRALSLAFSETVPLQDFAGFVSGLLSNNAARDSVWSTLRSRWSEVERKAAGAPMIHRRLVEALGSLRSRTHLDEARAHLESHPFEAARQAARQTLERLEQDVALRERAVPQVAEWLSHN